MADGLNDARSQRVAELLSDFRILQLQIASTPTQPVDQAEYYTEGWAALRQCALDGQRILSMAADTRVPRARGGALEQSKAELQQVCIDAFSRRHEAQKIVLRILAVQRWVGWRAQVVSASTSSTTPHAGHVSALQACDIALRSELALITDDNVWCGLRCSDEELGRWVDEDPGVAVVRAWLRERVRGGR